MQGNICPISSDRCYCCYLSLSSLRSWMLRGLILSARTFFFFSLSVCFLPLLASIYKTELRLKVHVFPVCMEMRREQWKSSAPPSAGDCCSLIPCWSGQSSSWHHHQPSSGRRPPPSSDAQPVRQSSQYSPAWLRDGQGRFGSALHTLSKHEGHISDPI